MDEATDTRAQYAALLREFLDAWATGRSMAEQHSRLSAFRQLVHQQGNGAELDGLWIDPPTCGGAALRERFAAEVGGKLFGGPAAGPRPPVPSVSPQTVFGTA